MMFASSIYVARRFALMASVETGVVLFPGNGLVGMNYRGNTYPFRQDGSFLYFTGIDLPDLWLCLDCDSGETSLFGPDRGLDYTIWNGPALSLTELAGRAGITKTGTLRELEALCHGISSRLVHYLPCYRGAQSISLSRLLGQSLEKVEAGVSRRLISSVVDLRSIKSGEEIAEIRTAIGVSADMYELLMTSCRPGMTEVNLYARVQELILARGSREAFSMILSRRGEILHNHAHDQCLAEGDMLLVDSGVCSPLGYASDITRTVPVSGHFSARQRAVYEIVLTAQRAGIAHMGPGVPYRDCHLAAAKSIVEGLCAVGLMRGDVDEAVAVGAHALFFPHGLGHMLGLDVHDMECLGEDNVGYDKEFLRSAQFGLSGLRIGRRLLSGFVMTVEPGIYFIPALIADWKARRQHEAFIDYVAVDGFFDFGGIRIEDDVLVTDQGAEVLSELIPRKIEDIERAMV